MIDVKMYARPRGASSSGGSGSYAGGSASLLKEVSGLTESMAVLKSLLVPVKSDGTELSYAQAASAYALKARIGLYSEQFISAKGLGSVPDGGAGEGGSSYGRLDLWADYTDDKRTYALGASLGMDLLHRIEALESATPEIDLSGLLTRTVADTLYQPKGDYLRKGDAVDAAKLGGLDADWYWRRTAIDATALDEDTWYPVCVQTGLMYGSTDIEVFATISGMCSPSWSTHPSGFSSYKRLRVWPYRWGVGVSVLQCLASEYGVYYLTMDPIRGAGELTNSGYVYVYVRGGGMYYVTTNRDAGIPVLITAVTDFSGQQIGPLADAPAEIRTGLGCGADRLAVSRTLWGQPVDFSRDVSGAMDGVGDIRTMSNNGWGAWWGKDGSGELSAGRPWYGISVYSDPQYGSPRFHSAGFGGWEARTRAGVISMLENGHVGVGTADPAAPFHVAGNTRVDGTLTIGGVTLSYDSANDCLRLDKGVLTESFVTAKDSPII
ncbi:MAG: hypothetical protein NC193_09950 [bacterium]|nr:hypothetical protein [bacterium]